MERYKSRTMGHRGFQIMGDSNSNFKEIDAIAQFICRGHQVSFSTAGLSHGACQTEVEVFAGPDYTKRLFDGVNFHTVEDAVNAVIAYDELVKIANNHMSLKHDGSVINKALRIITGN